MPRPTPLKRDDPRVRLILAALLARGITEDRDALFASQIMHLGLFPFQAYFGLDHYTCAWHIAYTSNRMVTLGLLLKVYQERRVSGAHAHYLRHCSKYWRARPALAADLESNLTRRSPRFYLSESGFVQALSEFGPDLPWLALRNNRRSKFETEIVQNSVELLKFAQLEHEFKEHGITVCTMQDWPSDSHKFRRQPLDLKLMAHRISDRRRKFVA